MLPHSVPTPFSVPLGAASCCVCALPAVPPADLIVYQKLLCYVREFLARPCKHVGRPGPTCPFVPKVYRRHGPAMSAGLTRLHASTADTPASALGSPPATSAPRLGSPPADPPFAHVFSWMYARAVPAVAAVMGAALLFRCSTQAAVLCPSADVCWPHWANRIDQPQLHRPPALPFSCRRCKTSRSTLRSSAPARRRRT
jgi:hypothetical protein